jgi:hypothetical protein
MPIYVILKISEGYCGRSLEEFVDVYSNETALLITLRKLDSIATYCCYKCDDIGCREGEVDIPKSVKEKKINLKVQ